MHGYIVVTRTVGDFLHSDPFDDKDDDGAPLTRKAVVSRFLSRYHFGKGKKDFESWTLVRVTFGIGLEAPKVERACYLAR